MALIPCINNYVIYVGSIGIMHIKASRYYVAYDISQHSLLMKFQY